MGGKGKKIGRHTTCGWEARLVPPYLKLENNGLLQDVPSRYTALGSPSRRQPTHVSYEFYERGLLVRARKPCYSWAQYCSSPSSATNQLKNSACEGGSIPAVAVELCGVRILWPSIADRGPDAAGGENSGEMRTSNMSHDAATEDRKCDGLRHAVLERLVLHSLESIRDSSP